MLDAKELVQLISQAKNAASQELTERAAQIQRLEQALHAKSKEVDAKNAQIAILQGQVKPQANGYIQVLPTGTSNLDLDAHLREHQENLATERDWSTKLTNRNLRLKKESQSKDQTIQELQNTIANLQRELEEQKQGVDRPVINGDSKPDCPSQDPTVRDLQPQASLSNVQTTTSQLQLDKLRTSLKGMFQKTDKSPSTDILLSAPEGSEASETIKALREALEEKKAELEQEKAWNERTTKRTLRLKREIADLKLKEERVAELEQTLETREQELQQLRNTHTEITSQFAACPQDLDRSGADSVTSINPCFSSIDSVIAELQAAEEHYPSRSEFSECQHEAILRCRHQLQEERNSMSDEHVSQHYKKLVERLDKYSAPVLLHEELQEAMHARSGFSFGSDAASKTNAAHRLDDTLRWCEIQRENLKLARAELQTSEDSAPNAG